MSYIAADNRYENMHYRRCGRSGLKLPALSLGLWQNFGDNAPFDTARLLCRTAFDHGITHFDLANNYGPPPGAAETVFGRLLQTDFSAHRDELVISTKAGYDMWQGPYGEFGSRKHLLSSLNQSLSRMGLEYVDIFYSHRFDPKTPLEETMGALASAVIQGKALYVGISSYGDKRTEEAAMLLREFGVPCLIHQPSYSMINRWTETDGLFATLKNLGMGCIAFSPLAQGMLSDKYLKEIPTDSRAAQGGSLQAQFLSDHNLRQIQGLNAIAEERGQSLAQMALAWVLRQPTVSSALIGASRASQIVDCVGALNSLDFTDEELDAIDAFATEGNVNLWAASAELA